MRYGIRLTAFIAALAAGLALSAGSADAMNRTILKMLMGKATAYCAKIEKSKVYSCSVERCPCSEGLREVKRFSNIRTRPACVCTPKVARAHINEADATDYCVHWNLRQAKAKDRCFVVVGDRCPEGTSRLGDFDKVRGEGPQHLACRGVPPEEKNEKSARR